MLFSIGQSIKNIAFIDDYNDLKEFSKRTSLTNLTKIPSLSEEENGSEENEVNIMVQENEDFEEEKYEEDENEQENEEKEDEKNIIE